MIEVLKQMVEALECALSEDKPYIDECKQAIKAGKQAIAELESQEPVAMYREKCADGKRCLHGCHTNEPCYTHPPQRKPLTDEQILALNFDGEVCLITDDDEGILDFARLVEAAHGIKGDA